jgi:hypothetical protein
MTNDKFSSSSSPLQLWVGLGLLKQMSPAISILGIRPPISTTRFQTTSFAYMYFKQIGTMTTNTTPTTTTTTTTTTKTTTTKYGDTSSLNSHLKRHGNHV